MSPIPAPLPVLPQQPRRNSRKFSLDPTREPPAAPGWMPQTGNDPRAGTPGLLQRVRPGRAGLWVQDGTAHPHGTVPARRSEGTPRGARPRPRCSHEPALTPQLKFFFSHNFLISGAERSGVLWSCLEGMGRLQLRPGQRGHGTAGGTRDSGEGRGHGTARGTRDTRRDTGQRGDTTRASRCCCRGRISCPRVTSRGWPCLGHGAHRGSEAELCPRGAGALRKSQGLGTALCPKDVETNGGGRMLILAWWEEGLTSQSHGAVEVEKTFWPPSPTIGHHHKCH